MSYGAQEDDSYDSQTQTIHESQGIIDSDEEGRVKSTKQDTLGNEKRKQEKEQYAGMKLEGRRPNGLNESATNEFKQRNSVSMPPSEATELAQNPSQIRKMHEEVDEIISKDQSKTHSKRDDKQLKTEQLIREKEEDSDGQSDVEFEEVKEAADYVLKSSKRPPPVDSYARDESVAYYNDEHNLGYDSDSVLGGQSNISAMAGGANVMDEIENILQKRKQENDLTRDTSLYHMIDDMMEDMDNLQKDLAKDVQGNSKQKKTPKEEKRSKNFDKNDRMQTEYSMQNAKNEEILKEGMDILSDSEKQSQLNQQNSSKEKSLLRTT